jgi:Cyclic nucleotide-binding domain
MRIESSVTAITWLPFAVLDAMPSLPLGIAVAHFDEPPPDPLGDVDRLRDADAFREANELRAWIRVEHGRIVEHGRDGRSVVTGARLDRANDQIAFPAVEFPVLRPDPEVGDGWVRFQQTVGGRIGLPAPRQLRGKPYLHIGSATAWTTLELVIRADGSSEGRLVAASPFPHHSVYAADGSLISEHGVGDYDGWYQESFEESPWAGGELEEELDAIVLRSGGAKLERRRLNPGECLVEQGDAGTDMFLLLDGVLQVEIDGDTVAELGSGAVLGELAVLGDGRRTATLRAVRASRVAVLAGTSRLAELALARRTAG